MDDYQNVKIANEIIIVEKPEEYRSWVTWRKVKGQGMHQGYVVDAGNKKSLESALRWAECREYDESLRPTKAPYNWDKYYDARSQEFRNYIMIKKNWLPNGEKNRLFKVQ